MLQKTVKIGEKEVAFKSSAAIPRLYRILFKRDIFRDLTQLERAYRDKADKGALEITDLEIFENVAYVMARHADPSIPDTIEEPEILELWGSNLFTTVQSPKNADRPSVS